ncbi:MAG TPA: leucyl/phenylalanyl-tRNA--protein transferase [Vicinamibacterales bacterium]|nr:leucyl/phenylalanyl-tRNA--protein transferase [Vicinamibacterales bacterium]
MIPLLPPGAPFPPVDRALRHPDGLLAAGGDLSVETLVRAYARGIFPWYSQGDPILWWSPDPRTVLPCAELHVSRSLRRRLARRRFRVTLDEAFADVLTACAEPRRDETGTWLLPEMRAAYLAMHDRALAHSLEVWMDGQLAGGIYGVALGRMFFGESMFSRRTDGSKIALAHLAAQLHAWGMPLIDCQMDTEHLRSLGARRLARHDFARRVDALVRQPGPAHWRLDAGLDPLAILPSSAESAPIR